MADRIPERLAHLVYLDAFVPQDGQATVDLVNFPPGTLEARARTEGFGLLLPSLQPKPWDDLVRTVWQVTDEDDRHWMVERLGPTPYKVFTDRVTRTNPAAEALPRTYIRCLRNAPMPCAGYLLHLVTHSCVASIMRHDGSRGAVHPGRAQRR